MDDTIELKAVKNAVAYIWTTYQGEHVGVTLKCDCIIWGLKDTVDIYYMVNNILKHMALEARYIRYVDPVEHSIRVKDIEIIQILKGEKS